jgi:hypothetical protein
VITWFKQAAQSYLAARENTNPVARSPLMLSVCLNRPLRDVPTNEFIDSAESKTTRLPCC